MQLDLTDVDGGDDFDAVQNGLQAFNDAVASDPQVCPLNVYAREGDVLVGGLCGRTVWNWLFVGQVWVEEARRRSGIGRRLMDAAEAAAKGRGCNHAFLDTISLQAPGFYAKLGYRVIGTLEDFPPGERKFFMTKEL